MIEPAAMPVMPVLEMVMLRATVSPEASMLMTLWPALLAMVTGLASGVVALPLKKFMVLVPPAPLMVVSRAEEPKILATSLAVPVLISTNRMLLPTELITPGARSVTALGLKSRLLDLVLAKSPVKSAGRLWTV